MKTTTKLAAAKRLAKSGVSKTSIAYKVATELVIDGAKSTYMINGNKIRPVYTSGSGRFCSNQDHTTAIKSLLLSIGIDTEFSNDSKRGGLTGNLLTITTKIS